MTQRFLADLIYTDDDWGWHHVIIDYRPMLQASAEIPADANGTPLNNWALVEVFNGDTSVFAGDARIDPLPTCALETPVAQIDAGQMATMRAALTRRNIAVGIDAAVTYGDIIAAISLRANAGNNVPAIAELEL